MRPLSVTEVKAIQRRRSKGEAIPHIAAAVGRSTNVVRRVLRGLVAGKSLKIRPMDRIDIHHWWRLRKSIPTMAQIARKYGVTHQYIRAICYDMDAKEAEQLPRVA